MGLYYGRIFVRRRKSLHYMFRRGLWWSKGKWVEDPGGGASLHRYFKTTEGLYKAFLATPSPCITIVAYYSKGGWRDKWVGSK